MRKIEKVFIHWFEQFEYVLVAVNKFGLFIILRDFSELLQQENSHFS